ncbi:MAG: hypothetical protein WA734_07435, partial [Candidatus Acidiferrales bacterium]
MSRRQRGVVSNIDFYEHAKLGIKVPISLNKENGKFSADYNEQFFHYDTLVEIKNALYKHIQETTGLDWQPVIEVMVTGGVRTITDVINDDFHGDETYQRKFEHVVGDLKIDAKRYW